MHDLYRLPTGTWIDPANVRVIHPSDAEKSLANPSKNFMPSVCVIMAGGSQHTVDCSDWQGALHLADELGAVCNNARRPSCATAEGE